MKPDFKNSTYRQLLQSFGNVNREKYPDRFKEILSELEKKKPEDIQIIKVNSGYRIIEKDKIPQTLGSDHKTKSFSFDITSDEYLSAYFKTSAVLVSLSLPVFLKIWYSEFNYKVELILGLLAAMLSYLFADFFRKRSKGKHVKYIFEDDCIIQEIGDSQEIYYLNELRNIYSNDSESYDNQIDKIELVFEKKRKLKFSSFEPRFTEVRKYLKEYLSSRMNYKLYLEGNSII